MNITTLLLYIANFIKNRSTMCDLMNDITQLEGFSQATWEFIEFSYVNPIQGSFLDLTLSLKL